MRATGAFMMPSIVLAPRRVRVHHSAVEVLHQVAGAMHALGTNCVIEAIVLPSQDVAFGAAGNTAPTKRYFTFVAAAEPVSAGP